MELRKEQIQAFRIPLKLSKTKGHLYIEPRLRRGSDGMGGVCVSWVNARCV